MIEYITKAFAAWFIGFFPGFEIYVAIPAAIAMGLDYFSVVIWTVLGNYTPVILIYYAYDQMIRNERINKWVTKWTSEKLKKLTDKHGSWIVLIVTPWTGVWVMTVTMIAFKMNTRKLLFYSLISITVYAVAITFLIATGIYIFID